MTLDKLADRYQRDRYLLREKYECVVCGRSTEHCKYKDQAMRQHLTKMKDKSHRLWREAFYVRIYSRKRNRTPATLSFTKEELQAIVDRVFGGESMKIEKTFNGLVRCDGPTITSYAFAGPYRNLSTLNSADTVKEDGSIEIAVT